MINKIQIFDLDGTVIDSSHRQLYCPTSGDLNLANWIANSTPEKVMADSLLPLADFWHHIINNTNDYIMICTARVLSKTDYEFLTLHGLIANKIFSRPKGCNTNDAVLKVKQLNPYLSLKQFAKAEKFMYDDNHSVRQAVAKIGITPINPLTLVA